MKSDSRGTDTFRRIVVGVDGSEASHRALVWAARFALATKIEIIAVHAVDPPAFLSPDLGGKDPFVSEAVVTAWKEWRSDVERVLEEDWCAPLRQAEVQFKAMVVEGGSRALLGVANHEHADAVIVGRRGRGGLAELVLGSFSHHVVHHSSRPVIVVPTESE
jgi:nucleotide-binding universal stress UspA family protein